jgi:hypothetical protein
LWIHAALAGRFASLTGDLISRCDEAKNFTNAYDWRGFELFASVVSASSICENL